MKKTQNHPLVRKIKSYLNSLGGLFGYKIKYDPAQLDIYKIIKKRKEKKKERFLVCQYTSPFLFAKEKKL